MSKRKSASSVLSFGDVLNDINDSPGEENCENNEIGDNIDELCSDEEEIDSNPREEGLEEEQQSEELEDNVNRQQIYESRNQLTRNRNIHDIDSPLDENNYKEIVYINNDEVLEELCGYLGPKKDKNTRKTWWSSEHPKATGRQRKCDVILGRITPQQTKLKISKILSIYTIRMISWTKVLTAKTLG